MINSIEGKLTYLTLEEAYITTGLGLEFEVMISGQTASAIMGSLGKDENIKLYTILIHKEDEMRLIGFKEKIERKLFKELNSISGLGKKTALKVLSRFSARELIEALDTGDIKKLSSTPGVGTKTAQKIFITLREKLIEVEEASPKTTKRALDPLLAPYSDIINAAIEMGYPKDKVNEAVSSIIKANKDKLDSMNEDEKEQFLFKEIIAGLANV